MPLIPSSSPKLYTDKANDTEHLIHCIEQYRVHGQPCQPLNLAYDANAAAIHHIRVEIMVDDQEPTCNEE